MTVTNVFIALAFLFIRSDAFSCPNVTLTPDNNPYSFGNLSVSNPYNGINNCTWKVYVPYGSYALLKTNSMLSSGDSATITYPGGGFSAQLHNTHPLNTFWLPEGDSLIQLSTKANGSLSFQLTWNKQTQMSGFNMTILPTFYPETLYVDQLTVNTVIVYNGNGNGSLAIGVAGQVVNATNDNPHPLRSCFFYSGTGKNRAFITTFESVYPNVKLFGNVITMLCFTSGVFQGYAVIQTGDNAPMYNTYQVAMVGSKATNFSLSATGNKLTALTLVDDAYEEHTDITYISFSNNKTKLSMIEGGINQPVNLTITSGNSTLPYHSRAHTNTYIVMNGDVTFSVHTHTNIPAGANCPLSSVLTLKDSPYKFTNGTNPIAYQGPFQCAWAIMVDSGYYVVVETSGSLSVNDNLGILYPQFVESTLLDSKHPNEKYFLPEGMSTVYFSAGGNGTFQIIFTWVKVPTLTKTVVPTVTSSKVTIMDLSSLNSQSLYLNSDNKTMIGLTIAGAPVNASAVDHPFRSCFLFNQINNTFITTLDIVLPSIVLFNPHVYLYCVTPTNYYSGYLVVANNQSIATSSTIVSYVTGSTQTATITGTVNLITVTQSPQMVTSISNITNTGKLNIADGSSSMNLTQISRNSTTFPYRTQSQVSIFTSSSIVDLTFNGFTQLGSYSVASWIVFFAMLTTIL